MIGDNPVHIRTKIIEALRKEERSLAIKFSSSGD
jgi:hypothetical protein